MSILKKQWISLNHKKIAYIHEGQGTPLFLIHGFPTTSLLWQEVIPLLASKFSIYALDLMGFGESDVALKEPCHLRAQAQMIVEFMEHFSIHSAIFVGHDLGGGIGQILGIEFPQKIMKLVLANSVAYNNFPVTETKMLILVSKIPGLLRCFNYLGIMKWWASSRFFGLRKGVYNPISMTNEKIKEYLGTPFFSSSENLQKLRKIAFTQRENAKITMEIAPQLNKIKITTLVIWGENDRFIPNRWGKRLSDDIAGSQLQLIANAGHFFLEEKSSEFVDLLLKWLS